uniref:ADP-ribosylhydrolase ARH1 n=1 Tax=Arion vulgaris TaxID=1028688 RepID=A0A0B7B7M5_9EUPU
MIAYDAFLGAGNSWEELCYRSMFHGGDSDSTGVIAACWFGATYGVNGVPERNYKNVEYQDRLRAVGEKLYTLAFPVDAH